MKLNPIEEVLADYRAGKMVIMVDDEDRENEGDLLVAAECISDNHINYMAKHGRGLICLTIDEERCDQLDLPLMVSANKAQFSTNFTVSIEAAEGVTTGISAQDRAITVRAAVKRNATPADIVTPGHIFPIKARPGGVLTRNGHTEAGCDMARLAGFEASSVICEILKEDGTMARLPDLIPFAEQHEMKIGSIADLIEYRLKHDPTVVRVSDAKLETEYGTFNAAVYEDKEEGDTHMALSFGKVSSDEETVVRVHVGRGLFETITSPTVHLPWSVNKSLKAIASAGKGVLVLLAYHERNDELINRLQRQELMAKRGQSKDSAEASEDQVLRMVGAGGQILADQGLGKLVVLGVEKKTFGLSGFGLEVMQYLPDRESFDNWNS